MKLRSSKEVSEGERPGVILGLENIKTPIVQWPSRTFGKKKFGKKVANEAERLGSHNSTKKEANEAEIDVCVDNPDEDLETGSVFSEGIKDGDDKGLFLGSEVLDPIEEESLELDHVEEGNKSSINATDHDFKKEIKSPLCCDTNIVNGDLSLLNDSSEIMQKKGRGRPPMKKRKIDNLKNEIEGVNGGECSIAKPKIEKKRKRPKKEKIGVGVSERVVRLRSMAVNGGDAVVDGGKPEKKIERRGRPRKVQNETRENIPSNPMKKKETRGRPRKIQSQNSQPNVKVKLKKETRGRPRKIQSQNSQPNVKPKKETRGRPRKIQNQNSQPNVKPKKETRGRPRKIQSQNSQPNVKPKKETRGRPRKIQSQSSQPKKEMHGRPRKIKVKVIISQKKRQRDMLLKKLKRRRLKLMAIRNTNNRLKGKTIKTSPKIGEGNMGKGEFKELLRERMLDILLKAGWMLDRRSRPKRTYQDKVYIEPSGRSHWSITKAYTMLTKKVKDGDADINEVNAFIPIPDEEIGLLRVYKELGHKKKKNVGKKIKKVVIKKKKNDGNKSKREKGIIVKNRKPRLLARGVKKDTKKQNLVSWMVDSGVISSGWKVKYGKGKRKKGLCEGTISNDGIVCNCCNESVSVSEFAGHCGGKVGQPFDHIYLESRVSLRKCLLDSWKKEEDLGVVKFNLVDVEGDDPNDDTCNICGDGGNLICCDGCPSTFHQSCLDIQNFPHGDWNCIYCSCKFCGVVSVIAPDESPSQMLSCGLCEEKFHQSCLKEVKAVDMDSNGPSFCGTKCEELFERLQTYIGVKNGLEDGFSWTLLQRSDVSQGLTIREAQLKIENNSKLAVAYTVMDECFVPIVDGRSGTTIIRNVVYNCGSNFRRLNYAGFLTAVLEKGDELVTAASIRLHGSRLAEMPFIGTRHIYRRQGMCRRLLDAIESTLSSIGVEELIIPAVPELIPTWTKVFGFVPLEESKKQEVKSVSMMVFPNIDMLRKPLIQTTPSIDCNEIPLDAAEITNDAIANDKSVSQIETTSSNPIEFEQTEEDKLAISNGTHSVCDLNYPVKNAETTELLPRSNSFPDCTMRPCSTDSVTCGSHQSPESELGIENDGVIGVNGSALTSNLGLKNAFDLNLDPIVVDTDSQIVN